MFQVAYTEEERSPRPMWQVRSGITLQVPVEPMPTANVLNLVVIRTLQKKSSSWRYPSVLPRQNLNNEVKINVHMQMNTTVVFLPPSPHPNVT